MSLTTQSFTYALNNIEKLTKYVQSQATQFIDDEYFNKDDIFIIFTTFEKDNFATYLLPEPVFLDAVCVDPYALNITVLAATRGETLINDHMVVKNWFTGQLAEGLIKAQTLDEKADAANHR